MLLEVLEYLSESVESMEPPPFPKDVHAIKLYGCAFSKRFELSCCVLLSRRRAAVRDAKLLLSAERLSFYICVLSFDGRLHCKPCTQPCMDTAMYTAASAQAPLPDAGSLRSRRCLQT